MAKCVAILVLLFAAIALAQTAGVQATTVPVDDGPDPGLAVLLLLGITIGASMTAERFLDVKTLMILGMGLAAFVLDTAGGVLFAKLVNLFLPEGRKVNPMIGACGISAFPMSARVIQKMANDEERGNIILMHATGANVSGQLGSVVAGGMVLALVPLLAG